MEKFRDLKAIPQDVNLGQWLLLGAYERTNCAGIGSITYGPLALKFIFQAGEWVRYIDEAGKYIWFNINYDMFAVLERMNVNINHSSFT